MALGSCDIVTKIYYVKFSSTHNTYNTLLGTDHSCIFTVSTVMDTNSTVNAVIKICLIPSAFHIIQEDRSSSRAIDDRTFECYCICKLYNKNEVTVNKSLASLDDTQS